MKRLSQLLERPIKTDIIPTPGQDKGMNVSYKNPGVPGERDFKDKHVIAKTDYPVPEKNAGDKDELFSGAKRTKKKRIADKENEQGDDMYEAAANKKAEDIVMSMKKNKSDFVSRYGKDAESVMYATANKMSQEDFDPEQDGMWLLDDGAEVKIEADEMAKLEEVFDSLSDDHQEQFENLFVTNRETNSALLNWVRSVA
jgi:hypothetical protein|tara:strand:- start:11389 stop:11985 length:597 start_codon:yes stop_codon:yes gene_type:complete